MRHKKYPRLTQSKVFGFMIELLLKAQEISSKNSRRRLACLVTNATVQRHHFLTQIIFLTMAFVTRQGNGDHIASTNKVKLSKTIAIIIIKH